VAPILITDIAKSSAAQASKGLALGGGLGYSTGFAQFGSS
jgi:hypothetical protein